MAYMEKVISVEEWYSPSKRLCITRFEDNSIYINDRKITLSENEAKVFLCIASGEGKVRTHLMLLQALYGDKKQAQQKIIDVFVSRIRHKLKKHTPSAARELLCVWGRGFAFGKLKSPPGTVTPAYPVRYWVPSRKEQVLIALHSKQFSIEEVLATYPDLTKAELDEWRSVYSVFGRKGLRSSKAQQHRV